MRLGKSEVYWRWHRDGRWVWGLHSQDLPLKRLASLVWGREVLEAQSTERITVLNLGPLAVYRSRPGPGRIR